MGNQQANRLPKGREMMTLGHLNALLNNHKQALSESVDLLNFRIERMIKRLGGGARVEKRETTALSLTYLHRTLFVSFLSDIKMVSHIDCIRIIIFHGVSILLRTCLVMFCVKHLN